MAGDTFSELGSLLLLMMMAHSSQTRIVRKVDGQYMLVVAVETDSCCAPPTALRTDEGLG